MGLTPRAAFSGLKVMNAPDRIAQCSTLPQLYRAAAEEYKGLPAIVPRTSEGYQEPISFSQLYQRGLDLATGLAELGVTPRSQVALLADNRAEWMICDYAILLLGAADVPRGTDSTDQEILYIINHSDACAVIVENDRMLERVLAQKADLLRSDLPIIVMEPSGALEQNGVYALDAIEIAGKEKRAAGNDSVEKAIDSVKPEDLFTMIYTSGTTGTLKGVQLTHANMVSQFQNIQFEDNEPCLKPTDRMLSILPIWHSYERVFEVLTLAYGAATYYTSLKTVGPDLQTVKPTCMASAPRLWESLYAKIMKSVESGPAIKRAMFRAAYACSRAYKSSRFFLSGQAIDLEGRSAVANAALTMGHALRAAIAFLPNALLDKIVLSKLRQVVGGELRGTISGGGALPPHVDEFFNYIGIPVLEGYGLTETSPVLAVRQFANLVIGTVGPIIQETELRIVDLESGKTLFPDSARADNGKGLRGEIHVKGPQVMRGYYKDVVQTEKVLRDGWLNTGDIGMMTFNDCLKIVGRSKDTIVLLNGENLEPTPIESKLQESALVDQCMVVGQDQKQPAVLIVPAFDELKARLTLLDATPEQLCENPEAQNMMKREIKMFINAANGFKGFELVTACALIPEPFKLGEEMTHTFKLKRHVITEKYQAQIDAIYG